MVGCCFFFRIYVALAIVQQYRDWRDRESNPGPLAPQAKSLTTTQTLFQPIW